MVLPLPVGDDLRQKGLPWVSWLLLLGCLGVFAALRYFYIDQAAVLVARYALVPADTMALARELVKAPADVLGTPTMILQRGLAPLVGHTFLHATELHLLGNLLFLWVFGRGLERRLGWWRYLLFYLLCGVAAAVVHIWLYPADQVPMVGASGAIAGILGGYLMLFPRARIKLIIWLFFPLRAEAPAFVFLFIWFLYQVANAQAFLVAVESTSSIAYGAHCGGFVAGLVLVRPFCLGRRPGGKGKGKGTGKKKGKK